MEKRRCGSSVFFCQQSMAKGKICLQIFPSALDPCPSLCTLHYPYHPLLHRPGGFRVEGAPGAVVVGDHPQGGKGNSHPSGNIPGSGSFHLVAQGPGVRLQVPDGVRAVVPPVCRGNGPQHHPAPGVDRPPAVQPPDRLPVTGMEKGPVPGELTFLAFPFQGRQVQVTVLPVPGTGTGRFR